MANKSISQTKQEIIATMTEMDLPISHIAKETGTSRPTVRKYQKALNNNTTSTSIL